MARREREPEVESGTTTLEDLQIDVHSDEAAKVKGGGASAPRAGTAGGLTVKSPLADPPDISLTDPPDI